MLKTLIFKTNTGLVWTVDLIQTFEISFYQIVQSTTAFTQFFDLVTFNHWIVNHADSYHLHGLVAFNHAKIYS